MDQTLSAPTPLNRPTADVDAGRPVVEPSAPKLRGVPLIVTWVVLAGAPWVAVWQVIKHAM